VHDDRLELPTDFPPYFPQSLRLRTSLILAETAKEFPQRSQLEQFCRVAVSRLTNLLCAAARDGTLKAHTAPDRLNEVLHCVRVADCASANERFRIERAVTNPDE
jgi:hypothetical protein